MHHIQRVARVTALHHDVAVAIALDPDAMRELRQERRRQRAEDRDRSQVRNRRRDVLAQMREHRFSAGDVEGMHLDVGSLNWTVVAIPTAEKWKPETVPQCQFSLPYVISTVMHDRGIFLDAYTPQARARADVRRFMDRISAALDESLPPLGTRLTTRLRDGRTFIGECTIEKGHPDNPLTVEEVAAKFRRCAHFAAYPLDDAALSKVIENVLTLEKITDVAADVVSPLVPREASGRPKSLLTAAAS